MTGPRFPAAEAPAPIRPSTLSTKVGRCPKAEAGTQEQAARQQEQNQGVGQLEEPEAQAPPLGNQKGRLHEFPVSRLAQDLFSQGGAGMTGEDGQDTWRNLTKFVRRNGRLHATAASSASRKST